MDERNRDERPDEAPGAPPGPDPSRQDQDPVTSEDIKNASASGTGSLGRKADDEPEEEDEADY
jgi:hypothetical protein